MILRDNATIHFFKTNEESVQISGFADKISPPYTLELAPVDFAFRAIKGKFQKQHAETKIDFIKMKYMEMITNIIGEIKEDT